MNLLAMLLGPICLTTVSAGSLTAAISVDCRLDHTTIVAGEPVSLVITMRNNTEDKSISIWVEGNSVFDNNAFTIMLKSATDGAVMTPHKRQLLTYPLSQSMLSHCRLHPKEESVICYPLHLQYDTLLPVGKYVVQIFNMRIHFKCANDSHEETHDFPQTGKQILEVIADSADSLNDRYEKLYRKCVAYESQHFPLYLFDDFFSIPCEVRQLLWAVGPSAVSYQIDYLFDESKGFQIWNGASIHSWSNIAQYSNAENVARLLRIFDSKQFAYDTLPSDKYDPGLVWCIHHIRDRRPEMFNAELADKATRYPLNILFDAIEYGGFPYGK
ncbi:MAG: hypothetical protein GXY15_09825 [Candidatus Hydrogenedentes bacterium]|nr:hypothetical protein [Candidatus Hydrogenedentota bacterium]